MMMDSNLANELSHLTQVGWVVLIPVGVLLALVLYQLMTLLLSVNELMTLAKHELSPTLQDVRKTAAHVEVLTAKAVAGAEAAEQGIEAAKPVVKQGIAAVRGFGDLAKSRVLGLIGGLKQSFGIQKTSW